MEAEKKYQYVGVVIAGIFLYKEIIEIITRFYTNTLGYFTIVNNVQSTDFLTYMTTILLVLLLMYLFLGFGGKFKSPLLSISEIVKNLLSKINNDIAFFNKIGVVLIIGLLFIFVVWFSRYIINSFLFGEILSLYDILYNIFAIAVYFFVSYLGTNKLDSAIGEFMTTERGFWKIGIISFFYIIFLGAFYDISGYIFAFLKTL